MEEVAGWIAPAATMIAATMTAANFSARVTGWGFVVLTIGSIAWSVIGFSSGQTSLLASNGFLTLINLVGVWRWLGKRREWEDGRRFATKASGSAGESLELPHPRTQFGNLAALAYEEWPAANARAKETAE